MSSTYLVTPLAETSLPFGAYFSFAHGLELLLRLRFAKVPQIASVLMLSVGPVNMGQIVAVAVYFLICLAHIK